MRMKVAFSIAIFLILTNMAVSGILEGQTLTMNVLVNKLTIQPEHSNFLIDNAESLSIEGELRTISSLGHAFNIKTMMNDYNLTPKYIESFEAGNYYIIFILLQQDRNISNVIYRVFNFTYILARVSSSGEDIEILGIKMYNLTAIVGEEEISEIKSIKALTYNNNLYVFYSYMNGTGDDAISNVEYIKFNESNMERKIIHTVLGKEILEVSACIDESSIYIIWTETYFTAAKRQYANLTVYNLNARSISSYLIDGARLTVYPYRVKISEICVTESELIFSINIVWTTGISSLMVMEVDKETMSISRALRYTSEDLAELIGVSYDFGRVTMTTLKLGITPLVHYLIAFEIFTDEDRMIALMLLDGFLTPVWSNEIIIPSELSLHRFPKALDMSAVVSSTVDIFAIKLALGQQIVRYRLRVTTDFIQIKVSKILGSGITRNTMLFTLNGNATTNVTVGLIRYSVLGDMNAHFLIGFHDSDNDGLGDPLEPLHNADPNNADTDLDGLNDGTEVYIYQTDPSKSDSDSDMLSDYLELATYGTDPFDPDSDDDGLQDGLEIQYGADPHVSDTDGDGLSDALEVLSGTTYWVENQSVTKNAKSNPTSVDTDNDGLSDFEEYAEQLNPNCSDTDNDGLSDFEEFRLYGTNPHKADTDEDGLNDSLEIEQGYNPKNPDSDGDGINDGEELELELNPVNPDYDNDGIKDGDEISGELSYVTNPKDPDSDGDGLTDYEEIFVTKTNPLDPDTDKDLFPDAYDPIPTTNNYLFILPALIGMVIMYLYSYGAFWSWRKDIFVMGLSDEGGTPMFLVPEDRLKKEPIMVSSALIGIYSLISELSGKQQDVLVLGGKPSIILSKGKYSVLFAFSKKPYKKLEKNIVKLHRFLETKYGSIISSWSGIEEEVAPIKKLVEEIIYGKAIKGIEDVEISFEGIEQEEIEVETEEFKLKEE